MLGRHISNPDGAEAAGVTEIDGMGLLDASTVFSGDKIQTQTRGVFSGLTGLFSSLNGLGYEGYEIHMGRGGKPAAVIENKNVYGSYIHGIFDAPGVSDAVLKALCSAGGVSFEALGSFDPSEYKQRQYDLLADGIREGLDMDFVYRVINREL